MATIYPHIEGRQPMLVNPYTGQARDMRDVDSDPYGLLVVDPTNSLMVYTGRKVSDEVQG